MLPDLLATVACILSGIQVDSLLPTFLAPRLLYFIPIEQHPAATPLIQDGKLLGALLDVVNQPADTAVDLNKPHVSHRSLFCTAPFVKLAAARVQAF